MAPLRGWCTYGQRLAAKVPYGHWKTMTFIAALRCDEITAPCVFDQPINAKNFLAWVQQSLIPTLRPGDIVILDNLQSHKGKAVQEAIRTAGARLLFLPAYSPDLNPIEQVFAKLKHLMRKAAKRTPEDTWRSIGDAAKPLLTRRMPTIPRQFRLCVSLESSCSKNLCFGFFHDCKPTRTDCGIRRGDVVLILQHVSVHNTIIAHQKCTGRALISRRLKVQQPPGAIALYDAVEFGKFFI
jgi:transposase